MSTLNGFDGATLTFVPARAVRVAVEETPGNVTMRLATTYNMWDGTRWREDWAFTNGLDEAQYRTTLADDHHSRIVTTNVLMEDNQVIMLRGEGTLTVELPLVAAEGLGRRIIIINPNRENVRIHAPRQASIDYVGEVISNAPYMEVVNSGGSDASDHVNYQLLNTGSQIPQWEVNYDGTGHLSIPQWAGTNNNTVSMNVTVSSAATGIQYLVDGAPIVGETDADRFLLGVDMSTGQWVFPSAKMRLEVNNASVNSGDIARLDSLVSVRITLIGDCSITHIGSDYHETAPLIGGIWDVIFTRLADIRRYYSQRASTNLPADLNVEDGYGEFTDGTLVGFTGDAWRRT